MHEIDIPILSAVWSTDLEGLLCSLAEQFPGLLGAAAGQSLAGWIRGVQIDDSAAACEVEHALSTGRPFRHALQIMGTDGHARHVLVTGIPGHPGHAQRFTGAVVDLTVQQEALDEAVRSAAKHRLLLDNTDDLIAHSGPDGRYVHVSSSYTRVMGWTPGQMIGERVIDFLHPDDRQRAHAGLEYLVTAEAKPLVAEVRKRDAAGAHISLSTKACPVIDPITGGSLGVVLVSRDITQEQEMRRRLQELATHDSLTGLSNRAWIHQRVDAMLAQPVGGAWTTVLFIDLNGFKDVNDSLGHAAGDLLLQQVGERLKKCMRPGDAVARMGGDEFVVAARCTGPEAAAAIAQRLLAALKTPFHAEGLAMSVGASIGICQATDSAATTTQQLFRRADAAMYRAKAAGTGAYEFFEPSMRA